MTASQALWMPTKSRSISAAPIRNRAGRGRTQAAHADAVNSAYSVNGNQRIHPQLTRQKVLRSTVPPLRSASRLRGPTQQDVEQEVLEYGLVGSLPAHPPGHDDDIGDAADAQDAPEDRQRDDSLPRGAS